MNYISTFLKKGFLMKPFKDVAEKGFVTSSAHKGALPTDKSFSS